MSTLSMFKRNAAYAVSLGYTIKFAAGADPFVDDPVEFHFRDISIFQTARGIRVAKYCETGEKFLPAEDKDFFVTMVKALRVGVSRARDAKEVDSNPLLPHLRAVLRQIQSGERSNGKNPYCDPVIKAALQAIKDETGFDGPAANANDAP